MRLRSPRLLVPALAILALAVAPASFAAEPTTIDPGSLERGDNPRVPQVLGTTILDGDVKIRIKAQEVQLYGTSDDDYVVGVWQDGRSSVQRVAVDGSRRTVREGITGDITLSRDGEQLIESVYRAGGTTVITVRDARTGDRLNRHRFTGYTSVLDADAGRAVLGASSPGRTVSWRTDTSLVRRISGREGYFADIRADRLAVLTGHPYDGGCSVVSSLTAPNRPLWRSCSQGVVSASPNGKRLLTMHLLSDGPNGTLSVHRDHGRQVASYRAAYAFGRSGFETNRSVLMVAEGSEKTALVRCRVGECERASKRVARP
ncbi:hypothetical protein [Nocardioides sp.]|uniref:hypothetical protein n=1 Tax=Nocardioides sp. TaxID=35761 RepID=UPI0035656B56